MDSLLEHNLNIILNTSPRSTAVGIATSTLRALVESTNRTAILEARLRTTVKRLNGELAINIRKSLPNLNVAVESAKCRIGTATKILEIYPDIGKQAWISNIQLPEQATKLIPDLTPLIEAISVLFKGDRSSGKILVEGRSATLAQLANWIRQAA